MKVEVPTKALPPITGGPGRSKLSSWTMALRAPVCVELRALGTPTP